MRKKPTFVELANATLVENSLSPLQLPYCPTNDASHAIADLQAMTATLEAQQQRGEDIRAETVQEARNLGVDPRILEQMAQGVMSNTSQMHQEMMQQQQNAAAAQQRMNALHHEDMSRQMAATQQAIARNADIQGQAAMSLQNAPDRMAAAVSSQIQQLPRAIPDDILQMMRQNLGNRPTLEQFEQAFGRFASEHRTAMGQMMGQMMGQQQEGQRALMDAQDRNMQQTLNRIGDLQTATSSALVSRDQSADLARQLMARLLQGLMEMFAEAARGHHAMNRAMLQQAARAFQQHPNITIQNIDARQLVPQLIALTHIDARRVDVTLPAISNIMNTLNLPNVTPEALQNVARQLALSNAPDETPQLPSKRARALPDIGPELPGPAIPMGDVPDTPQLSGPQPQPPETPTLPPMPPPAGAPQISIPDTPQLPKRQGIKDKSKAPSTTTKHVAKAAAVANAAAKLASKRQTPVTAGTWYVAPTGELMHRDATSSSSSSDRKPPP